MFFVFFSIPLLFVYLLIFGTRIDKEWGINDIYDDMHYYCENNYEVYSFSKGAMDKFHFSIGKHYEILNIDKVIYIFYSKRNEVSIEDYNNYLNTHNCRLVDEIHKSK